MIVRSCDKYDADIIEENGEEKNPFKELREELKNNFTIMLNNDFSDSVEEYTRALKLVNSSLKLAEHIRSNMEKL